MVRSSALTASNAVRMKVDAMTLEGGALTLRLSRESLGEAYRLCNRFRPGEYEVKAQKKKRSLDANAYMWTLVDALAAETRIPREEIYRNAIRQIGGVSTVVCAQNHTVAAFEKAWDANGLGWFVEKIPSRLRGCTNLTCYYGSSVYDTAQMSRLIDNLIEDCRAVGIETRPAEEIQSLLEAWNE